MSDFTMTILGTVLCVLTMLADFAAIIYFGLGEAAYFAVNFNTVVCISIMFIAVICQIVMEKKEKVGP